MVLVGIVSISQNRRQNTVKSKTLISEWNPAKASRNPGRISFRSRRPLPCWRPLAITYPDPDQSTWSSGEYSDGNTRLVTMPGSGKRAWEGRRSMGVSRHPHAGRDSVRKSRSGSHRRRDHGMVRPDTGTSHSGAGFCGAESGSSHSALNLNAHSF